MTTPQRFERDLPDLLAQLAPGPTPDYRDHVVQRTARMRQRPAWTFLERWLPMSAVTSRTAAPPRVPVRYAAMLALLLLVLALVAVAVIGSRARGPSPFGRAENGLVAYAANGDIFTVDPTTGAATALTSSTAVDDMPVFSREGDHIVFERHAIAGAYNGSLIVARIDGSEAVDITGPTLTDLMSYAFSPDGRDVVYVTGPQTNQQLWIARSDGSGKRPLVTDLVVDSFDFRPPNGNEVIVAATPNGGENSGVYAIDTTSGDARTILAPTPGVGRGVLQVSPDGRRASFSQDVHAVVDRNTYQVHVIELDGTGDLTLPMPAGATFQDAPVWSNDGTRLAITRGYGLHDEAMTLAAIPADGSGVGIETDRGLIGCCNTVMQWSPDDSSILVEPFDGDLVPVRQLSWDPATGRTHPSVAAAIGRPAWQRR